MSKVFFSMICCFSVAIVLVAYVDVSLAANCESVVSKEQEGVLNWLGNVHITVPVTISSWSMVAIFDQPFTGVGTWEVWNSYVGSSGLVTFTNKDENQNLTAGNLLTFRFRVNYGRDIPQPKVVSLKFENREMCQ